MTDKIECTHKQVIGVEYYYGHKDRYDGVSEWVCSSCGLRRGRWSGRVLEGEDTEGRHGNPPSKS